MHYFTILYPCIGGYCDPEADVDVLSSVTEYFKAMGDRLKRSPINLVVVTFSDDSHVKDHPVYISGERMVRKALEFSKCDATIQKVYDYYPRYAHESPRVNMCQVLGSAIALQATWAYRTNAKVQGIPPEEGRPVYIKLTIANRYALILM